MKTVILSAIAVLVCWVMDNTPAALPLERTLAASMEGALRSVMIGLGLSPDLTCAVAPECSGLRTAVASAILSALVSRRWVAGSLAGLLLGLWLNLVRLAVLELVTRADPVIGHDLHGFALPLIILPAAALTLLIVRQLRRQGPLVCWTMATASVLLLVTLLIAPAVHAALIPGDLPHAL